ncbi:MAG TPA: DMT family transporter [Hyphomicrobium sp.]|jgi:bacterial/archaeal transporter family-2 protein|nr:DMT family transporter [Hyphomicrobium sp.]
MMGLVWSLLGVLSGAFLALQAPINAALGRGLGSPIAAAAASFLAGSVLLVGLSLVLSQMQGVSSSWRDLPPWMFVAGGILGAAFVTSVIVLTPKLGTAATMGFIVTGQLLAGLALDHLGAFGFLERDLTPGRIAGAALLMLGALLIRVY